jgi:hypothetical protein
VVPERTVVERQNYRAVRGRVVAAGTPAEFADRPEVSEAYFG